jgi:predicted ribosome quality control (RQC) complex YloA/Tae2 family protein
VGPTVLVRAENVGDDDLEAGAKLTAGYGKGREADRVDVRCVLVGGEQETVINVAPHKSAVLKEAVRG